MSDVTFPRLATRTALAALVAVLCTGGLARAVDPDPINPDTLQSKVAVVDPDGNLLPDVTLTYRPNGLFKPVSIIPQDDGTTLIANPAKTGLLEIDHPVFGHYALELTTGIAEGSVTGGVNFVILLNEKASMRSPLVSSGNRIEPDPVSEKSAPASYDVKLLDPGIDLLGYVGTLSNPVHDSEQHHAQGPISHVGGVSCGTATPIAVPGSDSHTTCGGSTTTTPTCTTGGNASQHRWYTFTPGAAGTYTFSVCTGTAFDTKIQVWRNDCAFAPANCAGGNDDSCGLQSSVSVQVSAAQVGLPHFVTVYAFGTATCGNYTLTSTFTPPPANDDCATSTLVPVPSTTVGNTAGAATTTPTPPTCGTATTFTSPDLWYRFVGTGCSTTASLCGSGFDTKIAIYTGSCGTFTCAGGNDDFCGLQSQVTIPTVSGTTYFVRVGGFSTASGPFTLNLSCAPGAPSNDTCSTAAAVTTGNTYPGDITSATPDVVPACEVSNTGKSVWYRLVGPPGGRRINLNTNATTTDTVIDVYCGDCTTLACGDGDDDSGTGLASDLTFCAQPGRPYLIRVGGFSPSTVGPFTLAVNDVGPCGGTERRLCEPCTIISGNPNPLRIPENEVCGADTNGGCNAVPPGYQPIAPGDEILGTSYWQGGAGDRDTDWYQFTVPAGTGRQYRIDVTTEFDAVAGVVEKLGGCDPSGACENTTGYIEPVVAIADCSSGSVTACLLPGDHQLFVAPDFNGPAFTCAANNRYTVTLTDTGSCGVQNDCCEDAIAIPGPFPTSVAGTTTGSSIDGDAGTCVVTPSAGGVWYSVVGTGHQMTLSTCNAARGYDTMLSVYCQDCETPMCVTGNDDTGGACGFGSTVTFCSQFGATYNVLVHGFGSGTGNFQLDVSDGASLCTGAAACVPNGACCGDASCRIINQAGCTAFFPGFEYLGDDSSCELQTVYANSTAQAIPDSPSPGITSTITVPGSFLITDVNVDLNISHTWVNDLTVDVTHGSTTVRIINRVCGSQDNMDVILDDSGVVFNCASRTSPPNYIPSAALAAFIGQDGGGTWTLAVRDHVGLDVGTLNRWSLHFPRALALAPVLTPTAPRPATSAQTACSAPTARQYRVDCPFTGTCNTLPPTFDAHIEVTNHDVVGGACSTRVENVAVQCGEIIELRMVAAPCPAKPPKSPRAAVSVHSGIQIISGESAVLRVSGVDCCGHAAAGSYDPVNSPSPLCDEVLTDGTCCPSIAVPEPAKCRVPVCDTPFAPTSTGRSRKH